MDVIKSELGRPRGEEKGKEGEKGDRAEGEGKKTERTGKGFSDHTLLPFQV